uniref:uncharacterized protein LOC120344809 n=1 Tax=Styela clava TaxID=7725 RepID=UPI001939B8F0|nr:uncharacterized protein LOC120344809 [Styela clava]
MFLRISIFGLVLCSLATVKSEQPSTRLGNPEVIVTQGKIEGKDIRYDLRRIDRFVAIPYASPPIGDLRFSPPVAHPGWGANIYDATGGLGTDLKDKMCMQTRPNTDLRSGAVGSEDCLYLNVWVAGGVDEARRNPRPVMVWIHGEGYSYGSSWGPSVNDERLYDMAPLALRGDIIGISINYRLGPFGFFSTGDENAPGNYGMLDQVMALQWIQDNIWAFGGDAQRVTIFGQSTGGTSVGLHMVSPMSTNLFSRAISESGTSLSQWGLQRDPMRSATKLAGELNCTTENNVDLVSCIKQKPAEEIATGLRVYGVLKISNLNLPWAPVVDGKFLPSEPELLIQNAATKDYLIGSNNMDGHLFAGLDFPFSRLPIVPMTEISLLRASRRLSPYITPHISQLIDFQYQKYKDGRDKHYYKDVLVDLYTDFMFTAPTYSMAQQHSFLSQNQGTGAKTFVYLFSEPKTRTLLNGEFDGKLDGAEHGEEVQYVFDVPNRAGLRYSRAEQKLANSIITYWTNFARTGNPNEGAKDASPAYWPEYDYNTRHYLELNTSLEDSGNNAVGYSFRRDFSVFWSRMVPQIYGSKSGICESVANNQYSRTKSLNVWGAETALKRPKFKLDQPDEDDFLKLKSFPKTISSREGSVCEGTGDFIRATSYGCIQGEMGKTNGMLYSRFLGIPYAIPPVGSERFEKPTEPTPWTGTRSMTTFQKSCPQSPYDALTMSEDCLYMNVYVPIDSTEPYDQVIPKKYAVTIWLHGGGYMTGDGMESYMGDVLATSEQVIVVTMNYRLGAIGFMSTGNRFSPGNYGLWDQNLAMQWVADNIEAFGGDSERMTIFGQGAGAESAQLHMVSPSSRKVGVNQTILQSGTLYGFYDYPDQETVSSELISRTACSRATSSDSVECVRSLPIEDIVSGQDGSLDESVPLQFAPVVDGSFLLRDPRNLLTLKEMRGWKFMLGSNSGDGTPYWDTVTSVNTADQFRNTIRTSFRDSYGVASDDVEFEYTEWANEYFTSDTTEMQKQLFSMYTSQRYNSQAAKLAFTAGGTLTDVYMYSLDYPYQTTEQQQYPSWTGVMHGGDIPYVWGDIVRDSATQGENPEASILSFNMMKYWANFAKTGNPSMGDQGVLTDVEWPRYRNLHRHYLKLDGNDISADSYLGGKETAFWNFIMPTLRVSCPLYMP